ncbi:hypothetical protein [Streptomyces sp. NPDC059411]|uniref:hypothetical protein n=1 Tax=Streptomyces sp. NPDC059411 TaxID=3346825 RepID=UPI0036C81257
MTDTAVTCTENHLWPHDSTIAALDVSAAKGAKLGTTVDLTMTGTAKGATFRSATTRVKVGGPDPERLRHGLSRRGRAVRGVPPQGLRAGVAPKARGFVGARSRRTEERPVRGVPRAGRLPMG